MAWDLASSFGLCPPTTTASTRYRARPIRPTSQWKGPVCPETWDGRSVRYVVNSHTTLSAIVISQDIGITLNPQFVLGFGVVVRVVGRWADRTSRCRG